MRVLVILRSFDDQKDFSVSELKAVLTIIGVDIFSAFAATYNLVGKPVPKHARDINRRTITSWPFINLYIPDEKIPLLNKAFERAVSIKTFIEVIGEGVTYDEMFSIGMNHKRLKEEMDIEGEAFGFHFNAHQKVISQTEQKIVMGRFPDPWLSKADLKNTKRWFWVFEGWEWLTPDGSEKKLKRIYFGKQIINSSFHPKQNPWHKKYDLSDRIYLGPTSTSCDLAFYMANLGLTTQDSVVMDPFVGTGSILVSIAHFKPFCIGSDIDMRVLKGYSVGRLNKKSSYLKQNKDVKPNIYANFEQYGLEKPEIFRLDSSTTNFSCEGFLDAIICDPPYGLRAGAREVGGKADAKEIKAMFDNYEDNWHGVKSQMMLEGKYQTEEQMPVKKSKKKDNPNEQEEEIKKNEQGELSPKIISTRVSEVKSLVLKQYGLADRLLKKGGRLIYQYPVNRDIDEPEKKIIKDDRFYLEDWAENKLSFKKSRILVTMTKL